MSSSKGRDSFPDVEAKLQKPAKQSAFEKQKAEAEAKRQREAAETAAVYEDFVKSFDRDDDEPSSGNTRGAPSQPRSRPAFGGGPPSTLGASKRHFGTSALKSGPGSLGPPPTSYGKKRSFQDLQSSRNPRERGVLGFDEPDRPSSSVPKAFDASDDDDERTKPIDRAEEKAIAKPTLRLSNLPPGTSPAVIKSLMPENLTVENVKLLPPAGNGGNERKSAVAIVTLSQETPANDMDGAVSSLQNKYLGYGYYLSIHRHLSSAVSMNLPILTSGSSGPASHPFGAKLVENSSASDRAANQQRGFHRGFAPPSSYNSQGASVNRSNLLHVAVKQPQDIRTLRAINMVIEKVLEHGPEFEALLMSRPEVQREEKWAWIWDARSEGGVWYRWRLWEIVTGTETSRSKEKYFPLFEGSYAWKRPDKRVPFEFVTKLEEFVSDSDYNSSDDDDEGEREQQGADAETPFLGPLHKAKLTHLLARLPTNISRLRNGDVARVTAFAIMHASRGVDEVVEMIISNVLRPFALTGANPNKKSEGKDAQQGASGGDDATTTGGEATDASAASLVGLYIVSDILSASANSGVRHAWRFRQLFETALKNHKVFERLGSMAEKQGWGRLRADKWKRSILFVLNLWEGWCVFPSESQELFVSTFENPPSSKVEEKTEDDQRRGGKWKVVEKSLAGGNNLNSVGEKKHSTVANGSGDDEVETKGPIDGSGGGGGGGDDVEGEPMQADDLDEGSMQLNDDVEGEPIDDDDVEGEPIEEDDDVAGEPIEEEEDDVAGEPIEEEDDDVTGEPITEDDVAGEPIEEDEIMEDDVPKGTGDAAPKAADAEGVAVKAQPLDNPPQQRAGLGQPRKRMRAVDMFADSDGSDGGP